MSLKIEKKNEGTKDTVFLTGRLDTATAPELDTFAEKELINTQELVLDFAGLEYISSAGLRVILKMQKFMNVKGTMKLIHVSHERFLIFFDKKIRICRFIRICIAANAKKRSLCFFIWFMFCTHIQRKNH